MLRAAQEIDAGLIDARLGGCLVKKRLARTGGGKRGGYRLIIAYRQGDRVVCLFLFGKNQRDNISSRELHALLLIGEGYVSATADQLAALVAAGELSEVTDDGG